MSSKATYFILAITAALLSLTAWLGTFGDEQENISAGWLILQGFVPYRDFFFHHAPLPFFIAGLAELMSAGNGLVVARLIIALLHLFTYFLTLKFSHKNLHPPIYLTALATSSILIPTFHLQMLLADTLIVLGLIFMLFTTTSWWLYDSPKTNRVIPIYFATTLVAITSSVASIFFLSLIGICIALKLRADHQLTRVFFETKKTILWVIVLFGSFPLYFLLSRALEKAWWSVFVYNQKFYFPFRLAENDFERDYGILARISQQFFFFIQRSTTELALSTKNVISTAIHIPEAIATNSIAELPQYLAIMFSEFGNSLFKLEISLLVMLLITMLVLLWKKPILVLPALVFLVSLRFRSNELFHIGPFVIGLLIFFLIELQLIAEKRIKIFLIIFAIPLLFSQTKSYISFLKEKMPLVNPAQTELANKVAEHSLPADTLLVIDGDTYLYYLTKKLPATPYFYYLPWFSRADRITSGISHSLQQKTADIVYINTSNEESSLPEFRSLLKAHFTEVAPNIWKPAAI